MLTRERLNWLNPEKEHGDYSLGELWEQIELDRQTIREEMQVGVNESEHEKRRQDFWMSVWVAYAGSNMGIDRERGTLWADTALRDFDKRFNAIPSLNKRLSH